MVFANPVFLGYSGNPDTGKTGIVFLDDSFSMSGKDEKGSFLEQGKKCLGDILSSYREPDNLYVMTSSSAVTNRGIPLYSGISGLLDSMNNSSVSYLPLNLPGLLNKADDILKSSVMLVDEIFVISDFHGTNLQKPVSENQYSHLSGDKVHFYAVNTGNREPANISILKAEVMTRLPEVSKEVKVRISVHNHNNFTVTNKVLLLIVNNIKTSEKAIDISANETAEFELSFKPDKPGDFSGYAEIVRTDAIDDEILQDDRRYFTIKIPEFYRVAVFSEKSGDSRYVKLALETADNELTGNSKTFRMSDISSFGELAGYNALFICGKKSFSQEEGIKISEYLNGGGGVFIFPPPDADVSSYNINLLSKAGGMSIGELIKPKENENPRVKFDRINFEHPLLSGIFKNDRLSSTADGNVIESPMLKSYFNLLSSNFTISLIALSDKHLFISESKVSGGKLLLCAVSSTDNMSDFPQKPLFLPLITRSVAYLARDVNPPLEYTIGLNNLWTSNTIPGIYSAGNAFAKNESKTAFNTDTTESFLKKASGKEIEDYFSKAGLRHIHYLNNTSDIVKIINQNRDGKELWLYFLFITFALMVVEIIYAKSIEKM